MESIRELLDNCKREYSQLSAVKWPVGQDVFLITYNELEENASLVRRGLSAEGFNRDHIAIIGHSSVDWLQAFFGITSGDNAAVLLDPLLPDEELAELIARSDSKAVFLDDSKRDMADKEIQQGI